MTALAIRKKLHQFIDSIEEKKVKAIYTIFENEIIQGERVSLEQYNKEIDEAMGEIKKGEVYFNDDVKKMAKNW